MGSSRSFVTSHIASVLCAAHALIERSACIDRALVGHMTERCGYTVLCTAERWASASLEQAERDALQEVHGCTSHKLRGCTVCLGAETRLTILPNLLNTSMKRCSCLPR